jgi:hypothetical protein
VSALATGTDTLTATDSNTDIAGSADFTVGGPQLVSIAVSSANGQQVPAGYVLQFHATGTYSDNSTKDITSSVTWTTFDPAVATISNGAGVTGLLSGVKAGSTTVLASSGNVQGFTAVTVKIATLSSLTLTPANATVALGGSQQFTATGAFSDGETLDLTDQAVWASSNTGVATISNTPGSQGLASASGGIGGSTTISATLNGVTSSVTLKRALL